jgi:outer membrane receptor protein involved in Fe transport
VLNGSTVGLYLVQAHAITLLYMQIVWYWVGKNEKETHKHADYHESTHVAAIYNTKEMQYALFLALVLVGLLPLLQANAPLDYNTSDLGTRLAPLAFLVIAVWGTLYLQDLRLDDHYGKDAVKAVDKDGMALQGKALLVWQATRITGGKLAVSLLLLAFGTLYEFNLVGEYFRNLRAYADKLPERAWQYDLVSKYTIGTGFPATSAVYL